MGLILIRRIAGAAVDLLLVSLIAYALICQEPGDPAVFLRLTGTANDPLPRSIEPRIALVRFR